MERSPEEEPETALRNKGIDPEKIEIVILSHLHWDHAFNNNLFPNAEFFVQEKELRYAISPLPVHMKGYESMAIGMSPQYIVNTKYTIIDGDMDIVPGVSVILTPGHSPGSMCTVVETKEGKYGIATDTIPLWENWENPVPHIPHLPCSIHVGLIEYFDSLEKIEKSCDFILPGHDLKVFDQDQYPKD
jgi:glyoxylase-like metal-dependent hydrolase (beta-lactamase superfamily II)